MKLSSKLETLCCKKLTYVSYDGTISSSLTHKNKVIKVLKQNTEYQPSKSQDLSYLQLSTLVLGQTRPKPLSHHLKYL